MLPTEVHAVWSTNGSGTYRSVTTFWPKLSSTQLEGQIISWTDEKLVLLTQVRAIVCSSSPKHVSGTWNKSNTLRCGQTNTGIVLMIFWHTHQRLLETYTIYITMKSMWHNYLNLTKSGTTIYPIYTTLGSSEMSQKTRHFETTPHVDICLLIFFCGGMFKKTNDHQPLVVKPCPLCLLDFQFFNDVWQTHLTQTRYESPSVWP